MGGRRGKKLPRTGPCPDVKQPAERCVPDFSFCTLMGAVRGRAEAGGTVLGLQVHLTVSSVQRVLDQHVLRLHYSLCCAGLGKRSAHYLTPGTLIVGLTSTPRHTVRCQDCRFGPPRHVLSFHGHSLVLEERGRLEASSSLIWNPLYIWREAVADVRLVAIVLWAA
ncbi:hypothetical protein BD289DRAFT_121264 [Coniella lustricola]|uniref:Uncharacterized protein n=1 Tax=Coniella lustricola TaxID=2025994 RepID=A0A2T2ZWM9_9PEZI|nr:hypothetical protein BD289DRAFT_121264 [Coniella lustricola]